MNDRRNCPNCGAPYDPELDTCPYCKTSYFDLTAIDLRSRDPFYLKLRMDNLVFTCKAVVSDAGVVVSSDEVDAVDTLGNKVCSFVTARRCDINVSFSAVSDYKNILFQVKVKEE